MVTRGTRPDHAADPVFVIGSGRCGTTILRRALAADRGYRSPGFEAHLFTDTARQTGLAYVGALLEEDEAARAARLAELRAHIAGRYDFRSGERHLGYHAFIGRAAFDALLDMLEAELEAANDLVGLGRAVRRFADSLFAYFPGCGARWIEDDPRNAWCVAEIAALLPDARFVHPIRDGRAVTASMLRRGFLSDPASAMRRWRDRVTEARESGRTLGTARYHEIDFAQLSEKPETLFGAVLGFLGEPDEPRLLPEFIPGRPALFDRDLAMHDALLEAIAPELACEFGWIARCAPLGSAGVSPI